MPRVERPNAAIYYEVCGEGPPLVFAHGAGGNTLVWWQQVPYFAARYRVVTFDHRGFGRSTRGMRDVSRGRRARSAAADRRGAARAR